MWQILKPYYNGAYKRARKLGQDITHYLIGWKGDPHFSPFHLASYVFIIGGFWLISAAWKQLFKAQKADHLATAGPYARIRHPQYLGFILIMIGFLLQWPTFATLAMFPVLLVVLTFIGLFLLAVSMNEFIDPRSRLGRGTS